MRRFAATRAALLMAAAATLLLGALPLSASVFEDEMLTVGGGQLAVAPLPAGPAAAASPADPRITAIFALPSGKVLAAATIATDDPPPMSFRNTLNELRPDGSLRRLRTIPGNFLVGSAAVLDLDLDSRGRLYLMLSFPSTEVPNTTFIRLEEIDPETGAARGLFDLPKGSSIATAPDGLWILVDGFLRRLDPDSRRLGPVLAELGSAGNLEADSAGRLYFNRVCSPPCSRLASFDPEIGGAAVAAPDALFAGVSGITRFTIRRRCYESATVRCLGGGRFRTEVAYAAYDGHSGDANLAPDRSRDTSIFWFFDPDNWELMVKALDGCAINGHYWIYASASTDVGYTMTITDSATGAERVYANPLGQIALTVTDSNAFACSP